MADRRTEGMMDQVRGRIKAAWGGLTDDDIKQAEGNTENLVGKIKERTGEAEDSIRNKLRELMGNNEQQ